MVFHLLGHSVHDHHLFSENTLPVSAKILMQRQGQLLEAVKDSVKLWPLVF